jgi:hypothetical protein
LDPKALSLLIRLGRDGGVIGEAATLSSAYADPPGLALKGSDLLTLYGPNVALSPVAPFSIGTLHPIGQTLNEQPRIELAASNGQYLAVWLENTKNNVVELRASRVNAGGDYLDGEGIVLRAAPPPVNPLLATDPFAVDSDGTNWLVVWADGTVHGTRISRGGAKLDATPIELGPGYEVAVRWNGARYLVLTSDRASISAIAVEANGVAAAPKTLARSTRPALRLEFPALVSAQGKTFAMFDANAPYFPPNIIGTDTAVEGLRLDQFGNVLEPAPLAMPQSLRGPKSIAAGDTQYLVAAPQALALLPIDAPQNVAAEWPISARECGAAFDGRDFYAACAVWSGGDRMDVTRMPGGGAPVTTRMRTDDGEWIPQASVAADANTPALAGFVSGHSAYDGELRANLLFAAEVTATPPAPAPPSILGASRVDNDTIDVRWQKSLTPLLGIAIEVRLPDGAWRSIGVAPAGKLSARVALAGFRASAVRLRGWNASGTSVTSAEVPIAPSKQRAVR